MVIVLNRKTIFKFVIICFFTISGLLILTKDSFASNSTIVGFMIEADKMEGAMQSPSVVTDNTTVQKDQPMLELNFDSLSADGLTIKKIMKTPEGTVSITISSKDPALFTNLKVKASNAEFSSVYKPEKENIGFNNIKILAHSVTTEKSSFPQFSFSFNDQSASQLQPKTEEELGQMKALLDRLIAQ